MKRIYEEIHIEYMKEFLKKHVSSIIKENELAQFQVLKHVQYLDKMQLNLLSLFFNVNKLSEEELSSHLLNIGFFSKINIYEKRAIFTDYCRNTLIKTIKYNESLIDYSCIDKKDQSNLKYSIIKSCKKIEKRIEEKELHKAGSFIYNKLTKPDKDIASFTYLDPTFRESIYAFFDPKYMKSISYEDLPKPPANPITEKIVKIRENTANPSTRKITIYDNIDNQNIILRRKKSIYLERSDLINYHTNINYKLNNISKIIKQLPKYTFDRELYEKFDLDAFLNKIIFENNGIPVPTTSKYSDHMEFRKNIKGNVYFRTGYLIKTLRGLLMKQDKYLSHSDANFLAMEIRRSLPLPAIEYFYEQYLNSGYYKPIIVTKKFEKADLIVENEESRDIDEIVEENNSRIDKILEKRRQIHEKKHETMQNQFLKKSREEMKFKKSNRGGPRKIIESNILEGPEKFKRGRGRPRKVIENHNLENPEKFKRGRPRKVIENHNLEEPKKSKRGRPRKVIENHNLEEPKKSKRGRPRKIIESNIVEGSEKSKRGRGRPRKNKNIDLL